MIHVRGVSLPGDFWLGRCLTEFFGRPEKMMWRWRQRLKWLATNRGSQSCLQPPEVGIVKKYFPRGPPEGMRPCHHSELRLCVPNYERKKFCCFKPQVCGSYSKQPHETDTPSHTFAPFSSFPDIPYHVFTDDILQMTETVFIYLKIFISQSKIYLKITWVPIYITTHTFILRMQ